MRKISSVVLTIVLVVVVMAVTVPGVRAAGTSIYIYDAVADGYDCSIGYYHAVFYARVEAPAGETADIWGSMSLPGAGVIWSGYLVTVVGPGVDDDDWYVTVNEGAVPEHTLLTVSMYDANSSAESHITIDCTTGEVKVYNQRERSPKEEPYTGIVLLGDEVATPYASIPNASGVLPCGVFDVNGWGTKFIGMADFPACTPPVEVLCLNGEGQWTADNVSNVVIRGDYEVDFDSSQDGTCAFFPTS